MENALDTDTPGRWRHRLGALFRKPQPACAGHDFTLLDPALCHARHCHIIDPFGQFACHRDWLLPLMRSVSLHATLAESENTTAQPRIVLIDIDSFPDTEDAVDTLLAQRRFEPETPLIIGSTTFARHDFSSERRAIADASVRLPVSPAALRLAIGSAVNNNHRSPSRYIGKS
ncbi:MAG: hypothetical protein WDA25_03240 [Paracoccaceae bacterium]